MRQRVLWSEMLMILSAGLTFALVARGWSTTCLILCASALASWWVPWRYRASERRQYIYQLLLAVPFLLALVYYIWIGSHPVEIAMRTATVAGVYLLSRSVLELYRQPEQSKASLIHSSSVSLMVLGGVSPENPYYFSCLAIYLVATILFLRNSGPPKSTAEGPQPTPPLWPVAALLSLALFMAYHLLTFMPHLNGLFKTKADILSGSGAQRDRLFGPGSSLWSLEKLNNSKELVGRVFGPQTKLRGRVCTYFRDGRWLRTFPTNAQRETLPFQPEYRLPGPEPSALVEWQVQPLQPLKGPLPTPSGIYRLVADGQDCEVGEFDELLCKPKGIYTVFASDSLGEGRSPRRPLPGGWKWTLYLETPLSLENTLDLAARRIIGDLENPEEIAQTVESYLSKNGIYGSHELKVKTPSVERFLNQELTGGSELHATAMALLLRRRGIPTRYVVGYQVRERNMWGGYYMLRERDAQAWVEVHLEDRGWVSFDPSPKALTHPRERQNWGRDAFLDNLEVQGQRLWRWLAGRDWWKTGKVVFAILGTALLGLWLYRRRQSSRDHEGGGPETELTRLRRLFREALRELQRRGVERENWETPLEVADKAAKYRPLADWLRDYTRARFRSADKDELKDLETALKTALESLRK